MSFPVNHTKCTDTKYLYIYIYIAILMIKSFKSENIQYIKTQDTDICEDKYN